MRCTDAHAVFGNSSGLGIAKTLWSAGRVGATGSEVDILTAVVKPPAAPPTPAPADKSNTQVVNVPPAKPPSPPQFEAKRPSAPPVRAATAAHLYGCQSRQSGRGIVLGERLR